MSTQHRNVYRWLLKPETLHWSNCYWNTVLPWMKPQCMMMVPHIVLQKKAQNYMDLVKF